jgi:hypothetical protein
MLRPATIVARGGSTPRRWCTVVAVRIVIHKRLSSDGVRGQRLCTLPRLACDTHTLRAVVDDGPHRRHNRIRDEAGVRPLDEEAIKVALLVQRLSR